MQDSFSSHYSHKTVEMFVLKWRFDKSAMTTSYRLTQDQENYFPLQIPFMAWPKDHWLSRNHWGKKCCLHSSPSFLYHRATFLHNFPLFLTYINCPTDLFYCIFWCISSSNCTGACQLKSPYRRTLDRITYKIL